MEGAVGHGPWQGGAVGCAFLWPLAHRADSRQGLCSGQAPIKGWRSSFCRAQSPARRATRRSPHGLSNPTRHSSQRQAFLRTPRVSARRATRCNGSLSLVPCLREAPMPFTQMVKYVLPPLAVDAARWFMAGGRLTRPAAGHVHTHYEVVPEWRPPKEGTGTFDFGVV